MIEEVEHAVHANPGAKPHLVVVPPGAFDETIAELLAAVLREGGGEAPRSLALSGGNTPRGAYRRLAEKPGVPWRALQVYFGDERAVSPDDPQSNYRMAQETLLSHLPVPPATVNRMEADDEDLEAAAVRYERLLPRALDVLTLGIGADGHTASLFPGGEPVKETVRRVLPAEGPSPPRRRLTITPPVIQQAHHVFVLARGIEKAPAVRRALEAAFDPVVCPAQLARSGTWILDEGAAEGLLGAGNGGPP